MKGLDAVLSQEDNTGNVCGIAYVNRTLRPSKWSIHNYSSAKFEVLALKWDVTRKFWDYLLGLKFTVYTKIIPLQILILAN